MNTSDPPNLHQSRPDPLLPATRLPFPGAPPAGGWSTLRVAERLIQALERLIDLNEETARITALYRANLQQQQLAAERRSADARPTRDQVTPDGGREWER